MTEYGLGHIPLVNFVWNEFDKFEPTLLKKISKDIKANEVESKISTKSKYNLWESGFDYLESDIFVPLKIWIIEVCQQYINSKNNTKYHFLITESWAHATAENGFHSPHYHSHSTWSGIFYLTTNTSGANNWYLPYYIERKPGLEFADDKFTVLPKKGNLILFPSCILHDASPLSINEKRIVLSFNAECI